ncbi:carbohydrate kinase family protein [soil metagenome]
MNIAVTGSIATDHLMTFPGRFAEQLVAEQLEHVSLSFLVDDLEIRRGGIGANIAFGMAHLGVTPVLVGAAGADFAEYEQWLKEHKVDTSGVLVSETRLTARFVCTTDADQNQIASFYPGAMSEAREIDLTEIAARIGGLDLVVISPNDPAAMARHTEQCREHGYPFVADPSQQLARADGDTVRALVEGATYLFTNSYERTLVQQKTGWTDDDVLDRVGTWIMTRSAEGASIARKGEPVITVAAVPARTIADPTGVGDGFRAGFLTGLAWDLDLRRCAQVGATLATLVLEVVGPQEYDFEGADFLKRIGEAFGPEAASEIEPRLAAIGGTS